MINSLLELIGALFLASIPILLMVARVRRRRARAVGEARHVKEEKETAPEGAEKPGGGSYRRARRPQSPMQDAPEQRSPSPSPSGRRGYSFHRREMPSSFSRRLNRYPPLQRAVVMSEILGRPRGLD